MIIRNWKLNTSAIVMAAVAFVLLVFAASFYLIYFPLYVGNVPIEVNIENGYRTADIAKVLKGSGLILNETAFVSYVKLTGNDTSLKAGKYTFAGRLTVPDVVFILANGLAESEDIRLLVSEGFNVWEIDERLMSLGLIKEGEFSSEYYDEEGYLFPDTYRINSKAKGPHFILELRQRMADNFNKKTAEFLAGLSLAESWEIIVIASILEKEARTEKDMGLVSGIIRKRIALGMPLQVDATVIYGACLRNFQLVIFNLQKIKNCDVTFQGPAMEIKIDGPFNTYTRKGLPPSPISNPGLKAIKAALHPVSNDYLYYLSPRGTNDIIYAKTPAEHVANRKRYLGI